MKAKKYVKLPVEIEAKQFLGDRDDIEDWIQRGNGIAGNWFFDGHSYRSFCIHTLEGIMEVSLNDWVIKGIKGEFYPVKPDIFEVTYEPSYIDPEFDVMAHVRDALKKVVIDESSNLSDEDVEGIIEAILKNGVGFVESI